MHSPEWVSHCGLIRCMVMCDVPAVSACYYTTMNAKAVNYGTVEARGGCCARLGLARQLSGVGDAKFKVRGWRTLNRGPLRFRCMRRSLSGLYIYMPSTRSFTGYGQNREKCSLRTVVGHDRYAFYVSSNLSLFNPAYPSTLCLVL